VSNKNIAFLIQLISLYKDPSGSKVFANAAAKASSIGQIGMAENGDITIEVASLKKKIQNLETKLQVKQNTHMSCVHF